MSAGALRGVGWEEEVKGVCGYGSAGPAPSSACWSGHIWTSPCTETNGIVQWAACAYLQGLQRNIAKGTTDPNVSILNKFKLKILTKPSFRIKNFRQRHNILKRWVFCLRPAGPNQCQRYSNLQKLLSNPSSVKRWFCRSCWLTPLLLDIRLVYILLSGSTTSSTSCWKKPSPGAHLVSYQGGAFWWCCWGPIPTKRSLLLLPYNANTSVKTSSIKPLPYKKHLP